MRYELVKGRLIWLIVAAVGTACADTEPLARPSETSVLLPAQVIVSEEGTDHALGIVGDILIGVTGDLFVTQPQDGRILRLSRTGAFRASHGRRGSGPGEFLSVGRAGWRGDTLWVGDPRLARVTFFHDSSAPRLVPFAPRIDNWTGRIEPVSYLSDGSILAVGAQSIGAIAASGDSATMPLVRVDRSGVVLQRIATLPQRHTAFNAPHGEGFIQGLQPFSDVPLVAASADGETFAIVHRDVSNGERSFRVLHLSVGGDTLVAATLEFTPVMMAPHLVDSVLGLLGPPFDELDRGELFLPPHLPPISRLVVGLDSTLWLRREEQFDRGATASWFAIGGRGAVIGEYQLPAQLTIHEGSQSFVWGSMPDSSDVPQLVRYEFRPRAVGD